jgi:hypothetical protein
MFILRIAGTNDIIGRKGCSGVAWPEFRTTDINQANILANQNIATARARQWFKDRARAVRLDHMPDLEVVELEIVPAEIKVIGDPVRKILES